MSRQKGDPGEAGQKGEPGEPYQIAVQRDTSFIILVPPAIICSS